MTAPDQLVMFDTEREDGVGRGALLSPDGLYRYALSRMWGPTSQRFVLWVMLNPSKADAMIDDPTIRRCMAFSRRWGYDALAVVNLYAFRATDPALLGQLPEDVAVGPHNPRHLAAGAAGAALTIAAWGASLPTGGVQRAADVLAMLRKIGAVHHLGLTKSGQPRHPLYLRTDTRPTCWAAP